MNEKSGYRKLDPKVIMQASKIRAELITACQMSRIRDAGIRGKAFENVSQGYSELAQVTAGLGETSKALLMSSAAKIASLTCNAIDAVLAASSEKSALTDAVKINALACLEELRGSEACMSDLEGWLVSISEEVEAAKAYQLLSGLAVVKLPTFFSRSHDPYSQFRRDAANTEESEDAPEPIVKLQFAVDGDPLNPVTAVRARVQYDISVKAEVVSWPKDSPILHLDYITTMPAENWSITQFKLSQDKATSGKIIKGSGYLSISQAQSSKSAPCIFAVRARFVSGDGTECVPAVVIGHHELRIHALDEQSHPILTHYRTLDMEVVRVFEAVKSGTPGITPADLDDFQRCFVLIARYAAVLQQQGTFKSGRFEERKIDEKRDFQQHLLENLRMQLGPTVIEAADTTGGELDLQYKSIVIELKVEYEIKDRSALRSKYVAQTAQYSSTGVPLSITCILDMTEKDEPPANVANNISLENVPVHGFADSSAPYPSKVAVIIIDGNTKRPSDYS